MLENSENIAATAAYHIIQILIDWRVTQFLANAEILLNANKNNWQTSQSRIMQTLDSSEYHTNSKNLIVHYHI